MTIRTKRHTLAVDIEIVRNVKGLVVDLGPMLHSRPVSRVGHCLRLAIEDVVLLIVHELALELGALRELNVGCDYVESLELLVVVDLTRELHEVIQLSHVRPADIRSSIVGNRGEDLRDRICQERVLVSEDPLKPWV